MGKVRYFLNGGKSDRGKIQFQISYLGKQKKGSTNVSVARDSWNPKKQVIEGARVSSDMQFARDRLQQLKDVVEFKIEETFLTKYSRQPNFIEFMDEFNDFLENVVPAKGDPNTLIELIDRFEKEVKNKSDSYHNKTGQIRRYLSSISFKEWTKKEGKGFSLELADFDKTFTKTYAQFLAEKIGYANHSIEGHIKRLVAIINHFREQALELNAHKRNSFQSSVIALPEFKPSSVLKDLGYPLVNKRPSEIPFPDKIEIERIKEFDCIDSLGVFRSSWDKTRDCFLASCYTGARYGELHDRQRIDVQERLVMTNGRTEKIKVLINSDFKTKSNLNEVPCPEALLEIIEKWDTRDFTVKRLKNIDKGDGLVIRESVDYPNALFPVLSNPELNRSLHELLFEIGLSQMTEHYGYPVTKENYLELDGVGFLREGRIVYYSGSKRVEESKRRYEFITFHKARHAFGNYLLEKGYSIHEVSALLNHRSIRTTERWYKHTSTANLISKVVASQNEDFKVKAG